MSRLTAAVLLVPVLLVAVACGDRVGSRSPLAPAPRASEADRGPVVETITGSGSYVIPWPGAYAGSWRTFTMTARKYADGSVAGAFTRITHLPDGGVIRGEGSIVCFQIVGNTAWIGGLVAGNTPPDIVWQMVDNGEGAGAPPDRMGLQLEARSFGFLDGPFCANTPAALYFGPAFGTLPLSVLLGDRQAGNIQFSKAV